MVCDNWSLLMHCDAGFIWCNYDRQLQLIGLDMDPKLNNVLDLGLNPHGCCWHGAFKVYGLQRHWGAVLSVGGQGNGLRRVVLYEP